MPHTNLDTLPNEVLHNVFRFLNYSDLKSVLLVCKHLRNIGTDPTLWKRIPLTIRSFVPIRNIPRLSSLQNLTIHGQFGFDPPQELFKQISLMSLKKLSLVKTDLTSIDPNVLAEAANSVESLQVTNYEHMDFMTKFQLEKILLGILKGSKLKYLDLDTLLTELDVSAALFSEAILNLQGLKSVGSHQESLPINSLLEEICRSSSHLTLLDVQCHSLESTNPEMLASAVSQIETVDLEYCKLGSVHVNEICKMLNQSNCKLRNLNISFNNYYEEEEELDQSILSKALNKLETLNADKVVFDKNFFTELNSKSNLKKIEFDTFYTYDIPTDILVKSLNKLEELILYGWKSEKQQSKSNVEAFLSEIVTGDTKIKILHLKGNFDWIDSHILTKVESKVKVKKCLSYY